MDDRPAAPTYTRQFHVNLDELLDDALRRRAALEGMKVGELARRLLRSGLREYDRGDAPLRPAGV